MAKRLRGNLSESLGQFISLLQASVSSENRGSNRASHKEMGIELHAQSLPYRKPLGDSYHRCLVVQPWAVAFSAPCLAPLFVRGGGRLPYVSTGLVRKCSKMSITCYVMNKNIIHWVDGVAYRGVWSYLEETKHIGNWEKAAKTRGPRLQLSFPDAATNGFRVWPPPNHQALAIGR